MSIYSMLKAALRAQGWILARVPEDDELHAAELVDLLTEDNADGRARRFALAPWLTFERPVIARFLGETCILTIEGPIYLKDGFGYPLGSQMQTEFGWLALSPSPERRIWFVLDELADLPRVENLARLLPEGRKFGAAIVLTFQALGQMRHRYGDNIAEAMLACCNTKLFLQTVDRETRQWASETIGQCEVEMRVATDTLMIGKEVPRTTIATQRQFRYAVLESELRLAPHQGFLLLPDGLPVARIGLTAEHIARRGSPRQPAFVAGDPASTLWSRVSGVLAPAEDEPEGGSKNGPEAGPV